MPPPTPIATARRLSSTEHAEALRAFQAAAPGLTLYAASLCASEQAVFAAARDGQHRKILIRGSASGFAGKALPGQPAVLTLCDADAPNMKALRERIAWLRPSLTGLRASIGLGDRLGLATPGHIAATGGSGLMPILAQQSIREMTRTGRTPQQVMDEAVFGVFQCGYEGGFGSDADHLKTPADVDATAAAGFTFFTIDPSAHVDDSVNTLSESALSARLEQMIAAGVPGAAQWLRKYLDAPLKVDALTIQFDCQSLLRAAVKYGRAVAHAETMARHIAARAPQRELELSVDETALPTSVAEHAFIARELSERGVQLISLAPRFIGEFEKGIDYKGDLSAFEAALHDHAAIARHYGYKLSVHSGSDKFSVYPIVARVTEGRVHVKTAGTSYLEALRVVARADAALFREIAAFCRERYEQDRATYHVSATLDAVPAAHALPAAELERAYLDADGGRQILHVTFGSVLNAADAAEAGGALRFRPRLLALLQREAELYVEVLKKHIGRHVDGLRAGLGSIP